MKCKTDLNKSEGEVHENSQFSVEPLHSRHVGLGSDQLNKEEQLGKWTTQYKLF